MCMYVPVVCTHTCAYAHTNTHTHTHIHTHTHTHSPSRHMTHHKASEGQTNEALRQVRSVDVPRKIRKNQGCLHLRDTTMYCMRLSVQNHIKDAFWENKGNQLRKFSWEYWSVGDQNKTRVFVAAESRGGSLAGWIKIAWAWRGIRKLTRFHGSIGQCLKQDKGHSEAQEAAVGV